MSASETPASNIIRALNGTVEKEDIVTDPEILKKYSHDTSLLPPHMPDVVIKIK